MPCFCTAQARPFCRLRPAVLAFSLIPFASAALAQDITRIEPYPGRQFSSAIHVSTDGKVVVGESSNPFNSDGRVFRWTGSGAQDIGTLGGSESWAGGISANGEVVAGESFLAGNTAFHAFRWENGVMQDLGTLGGSESDVHAVSADGRVVVGDSTTSVFGQSHAYRWESGVMEDLGTLRAGNAGISLPYGVSQDGSVVIGEADTDAPGMTSAAFRWTRGSGMASLGGLGGPWSLARFVSADGSVVAGDAALAGNTASHAFRWYGGSMLDLGTLPGDDFSTAQGMSANGAVIVGDSYGSLGSHAFRWTGGVMTNLGSLGGRDSEANGVSANGQVVVGSSRNSGGTWRAFRWTGGSGMQSVEDWLRAAGVSVPTDITQTAYATNGDGSVVVGKLASGEGFIARATPEPENNAQGGSGLITLNELGHSLASTAQGGAMALTSGNLLVNGAHSQPLMRRVAAGQRTFWAAGDWGRDDHGDRSGDVGLAEVGAGKNFGPVQLNASLGHTRASQRLVQDGRARMDGTYLHGEALVPLTGRLWAVLSAYHHWGETDLRRGYLNAGAQDYSVGSPDVKTWGVRARLEWDGLWQLGGAAFSPYADLTHDRARMDAYTEKRGGFPARFDARTEKATELRLGLNARKALSDNLSLLGVVEAAHRFERHGARTRGNVIGLFGFDLDGQRNRRNWLRAGAGLEGKLGGGMASLMLNVTSSGAAPNAWLAAGWRMAF